MQVHFDETTTEFLQREILHAEGKCLKCGQDGHYVSQCPEGYDQRDDDDVNMKCYRCGRNGHSTRECYAKTNVERQPLMKNEKEDHRVNAIGAEDLVTRQRVAMQGRM